MLLRNPEIKKIVIGYSLFSIAAIMGAAYFNLYAAAFVSIVCIISVLVFGRFTAKRYQSISQLIHQLDTILHEQEMTDFTPEQEGELAVLSSEIYKLMVRFHAQNERLIQEKSYLVNSIADISHQLRTPLTSVLMIVPRLRRSELSIVQKDQYIQEINSLLARMEWLTDALLKIARLESDSVIFNQTDFKIIDLIQRALEPLAIFIDIKELTLNLEIPSEIMMSGDYLWDVEAIGNILKNCVEHIPKKESLTIKAADNPIYTEIIISDTGSGIAPEDLPHLFKRFYKGKMSAPQNTGIGLALSHMIISKQNGTVKVSNHPPHGAEFRIRFYKGII